MSALFKWRVGQGRQMKNFLCRERRRLARRDDQQHRAQHHADSQRVERPQERVVEVEGQVQQKLHQHVEAAGQDQTAAQGIQRPGGNIPQQRHHRRHQHHGRARYRQGEAEKPAAAGGQVDIQQVHADGGEVHRHEDRRIGPLEPQGQHRQHIQQRQPAQHEAGPDDAAVDAPVHQHADDRGQQHTYRDHEQRAHAADLLVEVLRRG